MAEPQDARVSIVVDASVLLAILRNERGSDAAIEQAGGGFLSAVHFSEILAKASDRGIAAAAVLALVAELELLVAPFDHDDALAAAALRPFTIGKDISFADRACLGVAHRRGLPVLTGDHDWVALGLDIDVRVFRDRS